MHVYEAGSNNLTLCVNRLARLAGVNVADTCDASVFDGNVGAKPGIACSINNPPVGNEKVVGRRWRGCGSLIPCSSFNGYYGENKRTKEGEETSLVHICRIKG
jgi:hypothetical protein